jgi:hypothetical protein
MPVVAGVALLLKLPDLVGQAEGGMGRHLVLQLQVLLIPAAGAAGAAKSVVQGVLVL